MIEGLGGLDTACVWVFRTACEGDGGTDVDSWNRGGKAVLALLLLLLLYDCWGGGGDNMW
jgi:hypothetical protein